MGKILWVRNKVSSLEKYKQRRLPLVHYEHFKAKDEGLDIAKNTAIAQIYP